MVTMLGTDMRITVDHAVFDLPELTRAFIQVGEANKADRPIFFDMGKAPDGHIGGLSWRFNLIVQNYSSLLSEVAETHQLR